MAIVNDIRTFGIRVIEKKTWAVLHDADLQVIEVSYSDIDTDETTSAKKMEAAACSQYLKTLRALRHSDPEFAWVGEKNFFVECVLVD